MALKISSLAYPWSLDRRLDRLIGDAGAHAKLGSQFVDSLVELRRPLWRQSVPVPPGELICLRAEARGLEVRIPLAPQGSESAQRSQC